MTSKPEFPKKKKLNKSGWWVDIVIYDAEEIDDWRDYWLRELLKAEKDGNTDYATLLKNILR